MAVVSVDQLGTGQDGETKGPDPKPEALPVFPFVPSAIEYGTFYPFVRGDFPSEVEFKDLLHVLWSQPEAKVYYYFPFAQSPEPLLQKPAAIADVLVTRIERHYYPHPKHVRDFMHLPPEHVSAHPDWYGAIARPEHEYWRSTLVLGQRKRVQMDILERIRIEEEIREQRFKNHYSHEVFLSYAAQDQDQATRLHDMLIARGVRVFMAKKSLGAGDDFAEEIRRALGMSKELWLIASPSSRASEWVMTEWGAAWAFGARIVPVLFRCDVNDLPDRLRKLHCLDLGDVPQYIDERFVR